MFVTVNGVRLFFDVLNSELEIVEGGLRRKPVLICLPGGPGGDHQTLRPFFDRFTALAQVIYLDPRASGRSESGWPDGWDLDQWGDDLAVFCDALGIEDPVVLGVSGGAMVVQSFLARHPDRARAAILVNACSRLDRDVLVEGFGEIGGPEARAAARAMYTRAAPEDVPAFFKHCLPHYSLRRNFGELAQAGGRATFNFEVSEHFFGGEGEAFRFDHRGTLGRTVCPVLVCVGEHDPVTRPEWGREVFDSLPPGRGVLASFGQSSHMIAADEPERFTATVTEFIGGLHAG